MQQKLRRYQSTLAISGLAFIALGVWSLIKTVMVLIIDPSSVQESVMRMTGDAIEAGTAEYTFFAIILLVVLAIDGAMRLFVGLSALAESQGKRRRISYVIVAGILTLGNVVSTVGIFAGYTEPSSVMDSLIPGIIDLTSMYAVGDLVYSAIRVKQLTKALGEGV